MSGTKQEPASTQKPMPAHVSASPPGPMEPAKPASAAATLDRPHDDHVHVDEPGYGHGV